ncbi:MULTISPECIES: ABC transporter substrate-binding protein [unclassified Paenibacillus]|uniref:ABC transporter substrate-binding protein n=1 Tax=unclassified Paenibacillus TaxID=185978 RepID=UPI001C101D17|nr:MULTISPECIES: ABC transporter substrate-binding protein [unclassified Paenibacillus]MBU5445518.1 ABC transporter substrate-binding protein [Paenibacillus sp. MSJ-34]CAH0118908.1 ABC transporter periplasmic-binding protein YtfQ [Paenibacillus sp. CECT 9249]
MKRQKPYWLALIAIMMIAMMAGCGNSGNNGAGNTEAPPATGTANEDNTPDASAKKIVVGFAQIGQESGWRDAETASIKETFTNDPQFELKFSDAQQKQENQIKAIRTFIAQKVDVIGLAPVVESGWETVLKEAKDAGIPVFLLDRGITKGNEDLYTSFIGSDFILEGENAAKWMIDEFGADATVNIVQLEGTVGASAANDRKKGFEDGIKDKPGYKIVYSQTGDFTRAKGKEVMEAYLKKDKNIQVVYAHNDDMALGAIQAIEEAGLKPGTDIKIIGVDGIKAAFEAIKEGKMNVTVECNPLLGPQLKQAILDLKAGKELEKWIKSEEDVYFGQKAIDALPNRKY